VVSVAAGILPARIGGIPAPGPQNSIYVATLIPHQRPPGWKPGDTAARDGCHYSVERCADAHAVLNRCAHFHCDPAKNIRLIISAPKAFGGKTKIHEKLRTLQSLAATAPDRKSPAKPSRCPRLRQKFGFKINWHPYDSRRTLFEDGRGAAGQRVDELRKFKAIFLGAVGHPQVKPGILEKGILLRSVSSWNNTSICAP